MNNDAVEPFDLKQQNYYFRKKSYENRKNIFPYRLFVVTGRFGVRTKAIQPAVVQGRI